MKPTTVGGGHHFVELQVVEEVLDRSWAFRWGVRKNQIAVMAHSGSRRVGVIVGQTWMRHAKEQWPVGVAHPSNGIFAFPGLELALVFDAPHNIVTEENDCYVHRKGATPARFGHPVLVPGSMGQASYLMVGLGNERFLQSASHGAGRKLSRRDMHRLDNQGVDLGLDAIECVTLKHERLVQEAPAAYKDIGDVVAVQAEAGIATPVARLRPLLTFKG